MTHEEYLEFEKSINEKANAKYSGEYTKPVSMPTELIGETADHTLESGTNTIALGESGTLDNLKIKGSEMEGATKGEQCLNTTNNNLSFTSGGCTSTFDETTNTWTFSIPTEQTSQQILQSSASCVKFYGSGTTNKYLGDDFGKIPMLYCTDFTAQTGDAYFEIIGITSGSRPSDATNTNRTIFTGYDETANNSIEVATACGDSMLTVAIDGYKYLVRAIWHTYSSKQTNTIKHYYARFGIYESDLSSLTYPRTWTWTNPFYTVVKIPYSIWSEFEFASTGNWGFLTTTSAKSCVEYLKGEGYALQYEPFTGGLPAPNSSYPLTETVMASDLHPNFNFINCKTNGTIKWNASNNSLSVDYSSGSGDIWSAYTYFNSTSSRPNVPTITFNGYKGTSSQRYMAYAVIGMESGKRNGVSSDFVTPKMEIVNNSTQTSKFLLTFKDGSGTSSGSYIGIANDAKPYYFNGSYYWITRISSPFTTLTSSDKLYLDNCAIYVPQSEKSGYWETVKPFIHVYTIDEFESITGITTHNVSLFTHDYFVTNESLKNLLPTDPTFTEKNASTGDGYYSTSTATVTIDDPNEVVDLVKGTREGNVIDTYNPTDKTGSTYAEWTIDKEKQLLKVHALIRNRMALTYEPISNITLVNSAEYDSLTTKPFLLVSFDESSSVTGINNLNFSLLRGSNYQFNFYYGSSADLMQTLPVVNGKVRFIVPLYKKSNSSATDNVVDRIIFDTGNLPVGETAWIKGLEISVLYISNVSENLSNLYDNYLQVGLLSVGNAQKLNVFINNVLPSLLSVTPLTTYTPNTTVTYGGDITATYSSDDPYSEAERLVEIAVENSQY